MIESVAYTLGFFEFSLLPNPHQLFLDDEKGSFSQSQSESIDGAVIQLKMEHGT